MQLMQYKDFKFPSNPETSGCKCSRSFIEHKYPELCGGELEDFGPKAMIISGKGEFFGANAYNQWTALYNEYKKTGVGLVYHPIFSDIQRGIMTSLEGGLEPRPNYISYSFEIIADSVVVNNAGYIIVPDGRASTSGSIGGSTSGSISGSTTHLVIEGECLSEICNNYTKKYGTPINWRDIAEINNISNPDLIYPGQKINIVW